MNAPPLTHLLRSRGFALCVHAGLWVLLYLALTSLGGNPPPFGEANSFSRVRPQVDSGLEALFAPIPPASVLPPTNTVNPFFTRYFVPVPAPAPAPPTATRVEVTYQGFYQTGDGPKQALVRLGESFLSAPVGGLLVTNLFVADATMNNLTLTNRAAQTNLLRLNTRKEIEVPLR